MSECHCGSGRAFEACCGPILAGARAAPTAEALMRARYSAYQTGDIAFLGESLHPDFRFDWDEAATRRWSEQARWHGLEIIACEGGGPEDDTGMVEFVVSYTEKGQLKRHHERSLFRKERGTWYYVEGKMPKPKTLRREAPKVGRNEPCPCGSGKKYKKCCGAN